MPVIEVEKVIPAPPDVVYAAAKDIERFPEFMPNVQTVEILEREGSHTKSRWAGRVEEFRRTIAWVEEDDWDDARRACTFRATEGDWDKYDGVWTFDEHPDGTLVYLKLDYDFNVPLIGPLIRGLLAKLVKGNSEEMLEGLARRVAAG
ncbi:MAG: SRPBCC family protein [Armatimonadota bacterium]|nr:MAG: SRPBCC family protein [Armatimonadota bacterium]